jgi:hypothetical protein
MVVTSGFVRKFRYLSAAVRAASSSETVIFIEFVLSVVIFCSFDLQSPELSYHTEQYFG